MNLAIPRKLICGCMAVFILGGCASREYQPDLTGTATARIRIVSKFTGDVYPMQLPGGACVPSNIMGGETMPILSQNKREAIGMPMTGTSSAANFSEHKIAAGAPMVFQFKTTWQDGFLAPKMVCSSGIGFTPEAGADYEAVFSPTAKGCTTSVRRLRSNAAGRLTEEPVPNAKAPPRCQNFFGEN